MALNYGEGGTFTVQMDGPFGSVSTAVKLTSISAPLANWKGAISPFSQVVDVDGISNNSVINLQLPIDQLEALRSKEIAFTTSNDNGIVTLYAIGDKPDTDLVFQATLTEVVA